MHRTAYPQCIELSDYEENSGKVAELVQNMSEKRSVQNGVVWRISILDLWLGNVIMHAEDVQYIR